MQSPLENDSVKIEVFRLSNDGWSIREISERLGISKTSIGDFLRQKTYQAWWSENQKPIAAGVKDDHHTNIKKLNRRRYILTSAQNNTFVHTKFFDTLEVAADHLDAQILVGTFSYNTNGFQNLEKGDGEWFDPKIKPYITDEPVQLCEGLTWFGELNILPTAVNPLSGFHSYSKGGSGIVPHAKMQLESLPTHKTEPCRMMYTTGAVTLRNYIEKKAGQKASFHHVFGALLVEVDDDGDWFVRQLVANSDTGEFQDLDTYYHPQGVNEGVRVEAINWGDIHVEKLDRNVFHGAMSVDNENSMLMQLKPKYQFVHDVLDMKSRNHHNINDPYFRFKQAMVEQQDSVKDDCDKVNSFLCKINVDFSRIIVVESNHDLALKRWLRESDYKNDPVNAIFFLECQLAMYKAIARGDDNFSILEHVIKNSNQAHYGITFLRTDESFRICGDIECGHHGHLGVNGSRGSIGVYQKLGTRYNIGHSHSAGIKDGVYVAGVSGELDMGYNEGGSSWSHSHIVTYPNGKRAIITMKDDKWRAL